MFARKAALAMVVLATTTTVAASHAGAAGPENVADVPSAAAPDLGPGVPAKPAERAPLPPLDRSPAAAALPLVVGGSLQLAWIDPTDVAGQSAAVARDEAARALRALGLSPSWRRGRAGEPAREGEIRVIVLDRSARSADKSSVLGSTPTRFESEPFVWVHEPGVRGALGLPPGVRLAELHDTYALGVALGRVVAHEILHALVPSVPHGEGLMKSRLTRADLTARATPVTPGLAALVHAALAGEPLPARPETGLLAAEHARAEPRRR